MYVCPMSRMAHGNKETETELMIYQDFITLHTFFLKQYSAN
jgi:hypothetical protein